MTTSTTRRPRRLMGVAVAAAFAVMTAACGSSAPASVAAVPSVAVPSIALPSIALPSIALPSVALPSVALPSTNPGASGGTAVDPAAGLTIDPPYSLVALPPALQQTLEAQMTASLAAFGDSIKVGFRQVNGGSSFSILMVMGFPTGTLSGAGYAAALAGMATSMGASFTKTTVDGVEVSAGKASTGGIAVFHIGDHMIMVISPLEAETVPIATAVIKANQ